MLTLNPVIPFDGQIGYMDVLVWVLRNGQRNCKVRLYANDYWPVKESVRASFTELFGGGYAAQSVGNPVNLGIDVTGRDVWQFPETVWTAINVGLPVVSFGYWVDFTDPLTGGTRVLQAQRFQAPIAWLQAGDKIRFSLSWGGKQC